MIIMYVKLQHNFNFSSSANNLILSYLSNRSQTVFVNDRKSNSLLINEGVPQGSLLGPLLFSLYINDFSTSLRHSNVRIYADDIQLTINCAKNDTRTCIALLNEDLNRISAWVAANKLAINPNKSQCLVICRYPVNESLLSPIMLNGQVIQYTSSAKNLGITLNSNLTWGNHIRSVIGKVYGMLRTLWSQQSSTPFKIRLLLCKTYLVPTLLYGCELFASCDALHKHKLRVLFNNIARYVFKRRRFDSISGFSRQLFGMSFDNLLKFRTLCFLYKVIYFKSPIYLFNRLRFARSNRGRLLIPPRYSYNFSEHQFYIHSIKLWNALPHHLQIKSSYNAFRDSLTEYLEAT